MSPDCFVTHVPGLSRPESRVPSPESRVPSPESRIPSLYGFDSSGLVRNSVSVRRFTLSSAEVRELVAFLNSLTDTEFLTNPELSKP